MRPHALAVILLALIAMPEAPAQGLGPGTERFTATPVLPAVGGMTTVLESEAFDAFGHSMALDGDELVVSAPLQDHPTAGLDVGAVYLFQRSSSGRGWNPTAKLVPSSPVQGQQFGGVAKDGNTIVVTAWRTPALGGGLDQGAVYVFVRGMGGAWTQQTSPAPPAPVGLAPGDALGEVAYQANIGAGVEVLALGARSAAPNQAGKVWVFERIGSGSAWNAGQVITQPGGPEAGARFGRIALSGGRMAVSAEFASKAITGAAGPVPQVGAVYLYTRDAVGNWMFDVAFQPGFVGVTPQHPNYEYVFQDSRFGVALGLSSDTLVVGAPRDDPSFVRTNLVGPPVTCDEGSVYVYRFNGMSWGYEQKLFASDRNDFDHFGQSVAVDGNMILVGTPNDDDLHQDSGSVYVFERTAPGANWTQRYKLRSCTRAELFGGSLAIDRSTTPPRFAVGALYTQPPPAVPDPRIVAGQVTVFEDFPTADYQDYCFGDGGHAVGTAAIGCSNCPCPIDNAPPGTIGGCLNPDGTSGRLIASGTPSVSADTLSFSGQGLAMTSTAILESGAMQSPVSGNTACPCGSGLAQPLLDGLRCIATGILRHGTRATDAAGSTVNPWGPPGGPAGGLLGQGGFVAGQTRYFQIFYRVNPAFACNGQGQSTSQGVAVTILP